MRSFLLFTYCLTFAAFIITSRSNAQTAYKDSSFYTEAISNAINVFRAGEKDQSRLYNARQYKPYQFTFIKGFPYFLTDEFSPGTIHYDGSFYDTVKLLYDEIKEMVIINLGPRLELTNERISQFTISGHNFIRLTRDSTNHLPVTGFYERLYSGRLEVYKREKKSIRDNLSVTEGYQAEAHSNTYYYLKKDDRYYLVKRKGDMLNILKDKKNELQDYLKSQGLNFKTDKDRTLSAVASYYDQITR